MMRRTLLGAAVATVATIALPDESIAAAPLPPALVVAAHPDDETLFGGVMIAEHLAAGQDVHVLFMTDGEKTGVTDVLNGFALSTWWGVPHDPDNEGYGTLTAADVAEARVTESATALDCLSSGLPGTLTIHRAGLPDGGVTPDAAALEILIICNDIAPGGAVRLKGHTYEPALDGHPDHRAVGNAIKNLAALYPTRFGDRRYYIEPGSFTSSGLSLVTHYWDNPTDAGIAARARNAARSYGAWAPLAGSYAIGWHSVTEWFSSIVANPRCLYHL